MKLKDAAIRALRTMAQSLIAVLLGLGPIATLADIKVQGSVILLGLYTVLLAGVISFLQNLTEDNSPLSLPKG